LVLFFFNTYAATTSYGKPARLDCWDGIEMINNTKFTIWGDPKWVPIRCPAYCKYRGDKNATAIGVQQPFVQLRLIIVVHEVTALVFGRDCNQRFVGYGLCLLYNLGSAPVFSSLLVCTLLLTGL
jgi:hypothetical protein